MGHLLPSSESIITGIQYLVFLKCQNEMQVQIRLSGSFWGREGENQHFASQSEGNMNTVIYKLQEGIV